MGIIVDEMTANVEENHTDRNNGEGIAHPAESAQKQATIELLDLLQERSARLAID